MPGADPLQLRVSAELVAAFAAATGDYSPIHVDPAAARRMTFREPVAHGCLCLCFLQALDAGSEKESEFALTRIQAQFLHPVFIGDLLALHWESSVTDGALSIDFHFLRHPSGQCLIQGSLVARRMPTDDSGNNPVPVAALPLNTAGFDELETGHQEVIDIPCNGTALRQALGIPRGCWSAREFFELAMLSPLVGMRLPGRNAILSQLAMEWKPERLPAHKLEGTLAAKSRSVHALKLAVEFSGDGSASSAEARVQVRMEKPGVMQPVMAELADLAGVTPACSAHLAGKSVLVTGASGGLGQVLVRLLALHGAHVVIHVRENRTIAETLAQEVTAIGGQAEIVQGDLSDPQAVSALCQALDARDRPLDGLVQNAVGSYQARPLLDTTLERVREELEVSLAGPLKLAQHVLSGMRTRGGVIVHVGSSAVDHTPPGQLPYVVAKSALLGLAKSIHAEFQADGIASYYVAPTLMKTDLTAHLSAGAVLQELQASPGSRLLEPWQLALGIIDLLAGGSDYQCLAGELLVWQDGAWKVRT